MKTLAQLNSGDLFLFGGVQFTVGYHRSETEISCQVGNTNCTVYIIPEAIVEPIQ